MINVNEYNKNVAICGLTSKIIKESKGNLLDSEVKVLVDLISEYIGLPFNNFKLNVITNCNDFRDILMLKNFNYTFDEYYNLSEVTELESTNEYNFTECRVRIVLSHYFCDDTHIQFDNDIYLGYNCKFEPNRKSAIVLKVDYYGNDYEETEYLLYIYDPTSKEQEWEYTPMQKEVLEMLEREL